MIPVNQLKTSLTERETLSKLSRLYCCDEKKAEDHAQRYLHVLDGLESEYGRHDAAALFSASGRTEIGGNHTDHQHGIAIAASVNMDMIAAVSVNQSSQMRLKSEGYEPCCVSLDDLDINPAEYGTSISILRGICRAFSDKGASLCGLDLYISSNVPGGSGISSSAAFETLLATVMNELFMGENKADAIEIAKIGQKTENEYFGKPCGLLDQMASSFGGAVRMDFKDPLNPSVKQIEMNPAEAGLALVIVDSGADHADLTDEYAAVPAECISVAKACGYEYLREVPEDLFMEKLPELRKSCSGRALLRAIHFFNENRRAAEEADALEQHDYERFLRLVNESAHSSWEYLQNITPAGEIKEQAVALTIALIRQILGGKGAVRVHGGGFAGTVQAYVPLEMTAEMIEKTEAVLGKGSCHIMAIRPYGGIRVL